MAIFLKGGVVFLHVPKTGGNWITSTLADEGLIDFDFAHKHSDASHLLVPPYGMTDPRRWVRHYRALWRFRLGQTPRFFFSVRNPFGWYESWYKYQNDRQWRIWGGAPNPVRWHVNSELNGFRADTFDGFMANVVERAPGYVTRLFGRYRAVGDARVLRNETLAQDLCDTLAAFGLPHRRERILASGRIGESSARTIEWTPERRQQILDLDRAAFLEYGYDVGAAARDAAYGGKPEA